jgi:aminoglycoside phosphotransferase (APT) family kinase protein
VAADPVDATGDFSSAVDLPRLTQYLAQRVDLAGPLGVDLIHGGRSNLTFRLTDGTHDWVLRRPPLGNVLPTAHDMGREFRVLDALHGSDIPVPTPVLLCQDESVIGAHFYVMAHVAGPVLRDAADTRDLDPDDARHYAACLLDVLVRIHGVPPDRLEGFGRPAGFMSRQVARWQRQWSMSATGDLPDIDRLIARLADLVPEPQRASLVHGDFRLDNVIFSPGRRRDVAAVIDWEMATLGDPLADLGLMLVYWDPATAAVTGTDHAISANPGFPNTSELVDWYGQASGLDLSRLGFYVGFGYFKLAVIAEGIHARYLAGKTVGRGFETVGAAVPTVVRSGLAAIADLD